MTEHARTLRRDTIKIGDQIVFSGLPFSSFRAFENCVPKLEGSGSEPEKLPGPVRKTSRTRSEDDWSTIHANGPGPLLCRSLRKRI